MLGRITTGAGAGAGRECVTRQYFLPGISLGREEGCSLLVPQRPSRPDMESSETHLNHGGSISEQRYPENVPCPVFLDTHSSPNPCFLFPLDRNVHRTCFTFPITLLLQNEQAAARVSSSAREIVGSSGDCYKTSPHCVQSGWLQLHPRSWWPHGLDWKLSGQFH